MIFLEPSFIGFINVNINTEEITDTVLYTSATWFLVFYVEKRLFIRFDPGHAISQVHVTSIGAAKTSFSTGEANGFFPWQGIGIMCSVTAVSPSLKTAALTSEMDWVLFLLLWTKELPFACIALST